ncbi:MAG: site-specific DNA-methyltransferase [Thermoplasmatales archaeon]
MPEYKKIVLELDRNITSEEMSIINEINKHFIKNDIYLEYDENKIIANLRILDLEKFKNKINELTDKYHLSHQNPFINLLQKIEDIGSYGIKSGKRLYVDYDKERKVKNRKQKIEDRGKYFYARDNNFLKINNEFPLEFTNKIVCADSEEFLKKLPDNCVDLIFTSPPYNFGLEYEKYKDGTQWEAYFDKLFRIFKECIRVLKYGGRIVVNIQPLYSDYIPIHHIISNFFMENKMIWKGEILWDKHNYNAKYTAWGSWKSPSNPYLKYTWEFLEVFSKGDLKHEGDIKKADITPDEFKKWVYAKWDIAPERNMKEFQHPAMFPEELAKRVIKLFSFENDVVLDPFNGVGTTTKVAKELNRRYLGVDISEEYTKKAKDRLKEVAQQKTLKII